MATEIENAGAIVPVGEARTVPPSSDIVVVGGVGSGASAYIPDIEGLKKVITHTRAVGVILPPPDIRAIIDKTAQFVSKNGELHAFCENDGGLRLRTAFRHSAAGFFVKALGERRWRRVATLVAVLRRCLQPDASPLRQVSSSRSASSPMRRTMSSSISWCSQTHITLITNSG